MKWLNRHKLIRFIVFYMVGAVAIGVSLDSIGVADAGAVGKTCGQLFLFIFIPYWLTIRQNRFRKDKVKGGK